VTGVRRTAALLAAWKDRFPRGTFGAPSSGEASNGDPITVEMLLAGVWTDITSYVMVRDGSQKVSIPLRGQSGESSSPDRSTCQFQLNNRDGRWTPRNPVGPYYGLIGRNTQVRFSVPNGYGGKSYRFWGEMSEWPQSWDSTGTDIWVDAEASGPMRRYAQGHAPTRSVMYDALTDGSIGSILEYWPCEDIADSTSVVSALTGHSAMVISGSPVFAAADQFPASDPLPTMASAQFTGGVLKYTDPTATQVRFLLFIPADGATDGKVICRIAQDDSAFTTAYWELRYTTASDTAPLGSLSLYNMDGDGAELGAILSHTSDIRGKLVRVSIELQESGANLSQALRILAVGDAEAVSVTNTQASTALTRVISVTMCPDTLLGGVGRGLTNGTVGHVTLQNAITAMTDLGDRLDPRGEAAGRRIQRICAEHAIPFDWIGDLDNTAAMGPQAKLKPLELMQECAAADLGILYENLTAFGMGYRTRESLYNQDPTLTLVYSAGQLSEVPVPTDDDQLSKNTVAVTRTNGNTFTAELTTGPMSSADPPAGIGTYGDPVTINVASDDDLPDQAWWRLHLGTVDEARYPQISVNLAHPQFQTNPALRTAVLALRPGDRLAITGPLPQQEPGDVSVLVLGFSETIDQFQHTLKLNCAPASPWRVSVLDDRVLGRLDTAGSQLAADITSTATALSVTTTSGPVWTTTHTETPFDLRMGGETVTTVALGTVINTNPLLLTGDLTGWTASNSTATYTTEAVYGNGGATASIKVVPNGSSASGGVNASTHSAVGTVAAGLSYTVNAWVYSPSGWADLRTAADWYDSSDVFLSSSLGSATSVAAGVWTFLTQTFTAPASASRSVARARWGSTPAATDISYWWNIRLIDDATTTLTSPQTMTVVRSINTVVKAQSAGTAISLANPTVIAL
jgi:hypothetical protein